MKILNELSNGIELDFDIASASRDEILEFAKRLPYYNVVLLRNLDLTKKQLTDIMSTIGKGKSPGHWFHDKDFPDIVTVTNKRDEDGNKIGLFADLELGWHCNGVLRELVREISFSLYCEKPGIDSVTSFVNTREAYDDLPTDIKELVNNIDCKISFHAFSGEVETIGSNDGGYRLTPDDPEYAVFTGQINSVNIETIKDAHGKGIDFSEDRYGSGFHVKPLVATHPWTAQRSLFFVNNFITDWWHRNGQDFDSKGLWDFLFNHLFQEKYIYHHKWKTGDWLWADQWNSFHRRNAVKGDRLLYRLCCDNHHLIKEMERKRMVIINKDQHGPDGGIIGAVIRDDQEWVYEF